MPTRSKYSNAAAIPGENQKLNGITRAALLSANEKGHIKIPCGSASAMETFITNLTRLESMGFVSRDAGSAFYRPFTLTEKGLGLKRILEKAEGVSENAPA